MYNTLIVNTPAVVLTLIKSSSGSHFTVMYLGVRGSVLRAVRSAEPAHSFVFLYILLGYLLPGWMSSRLLTAHLLLEEFLLFLGCSRAIRTPSSGNDPDELPLLHHCDIEPDKGG